MRRQRLRRRQSHTKMKRRQSRQVEEMQKQMEEKVLLVRPKLAAG